MLPGAIEFLQPVSTVEFKWMNWLVQTVVLQMFWPLTCLLLKLLTLWISSTFNERYKQITKQLTNFGFKLLWPHGCSFNSLTLIFQQLNLTSPSYCTHIHTYTRICQCFPLLYYFSNSEGGDRKLCKYSKQDPFVASFFVPTITYPYLPLSLLSIYCPKRYQRSYKHVNMHTHSLALKSLDACVIDVEK